MNALEGSVNRSMYALRTFSKLFKDERFTKTEYQTLVNLSKHHVSQRVKVRQNVSKHFKVRQMCVDDDEITFLINCTGHPITHKTPNTNYGLRSRTSNAIKKL